MNKKTYEELINYSLSKGAEYSDIYYEETSDNTFELIDSTLDKIKTNNSKGMGIRISQGKNIYYGSTNLLSRNNIYNLIDTLNGNIKTKKETNKIVLKEKLYKNKKPNSLTPKEIKTFLLKVDTLAREKDIRIVQVYARVTMKNNKVVIATSKGNLSKENRYRTRVVINLYAQENNKKTDALFSLGTLRNKKDIEKLDIDKIVSSLVNEAIEKLNAKDCIGGVMPVVLGPGFGAVIFHEACGHAMEATSTAKGLSVLSNKIGQKIASEKVTIIDDGTIPYLWGSNKMDDEGNKTQRNVLIENGVLKTFLVDELNSKKLKILPNGCSRRESYKYSPTSRMSNTYLQKGNDKFEDMISSISLGLFASKMGGGSVDPMTGDFNFAVKEGYMIRDGKICEPVKSVSLIGNTLEILNKVQMVSDNLEYGDGMCGSISGSVPVTIGEPYIKVSSILVGGASDK